MKLLESTNKLNNLLSLWFQFWRNMYQPMAFPILCHHIFLMSLHSNFCKQIQSFVSVFSCLLFCGWLNLWMQNPQIWMANWTVSSEALIEGPDQNSSRLGNINYLRREGFQIQCLGCYDFSIELFENINEECSSALWINNMNK